MGDSNNHGGNLLFEGKPRLITVLETDCNCSVFTPCKNSKIQSHKEFNYVKLFVNVSLDGPACRINPGAQCLKEEKYNKSDSQTLRERDSKQQALNIWRLVTWWSVHTWLLEVGYISVWQSLARPQKIGCFAMTIKLSKTPSFIDDCII